ncbi:endonuclease domain-containing protein [Neobacillus cucumis]|uniref:endonuclease domain-containing protein n=1 Tax=Neobacillus cucumis TaxID=1740721 RepID=UPI001E3170C6|nr:endonuclease domain-containing protein [Neobacillus cucumis]
MKLDLYQRRVGEIIKLLGIKRVRHKKVYLPQTKEVEIELRNPYLTHVEIAAKYGVTDTCVAKRRKELEVKVRKRNFDTLIEQQVEQLLLDLDLVYFKQKKIDRWSIDFYLGKKHCIDVHGRWSHSLNKVKERDIRKQIFMSENGFKYLIIHERELADLKGVMKRIKNFTLGFPC